MHIGCLSHYVGKHLEDVGQSVPHGWCWQVQSLCGSGWLIKGSGHSSSSFILTVASEECSPAVSILWRRRPTREGKNWSMPESGSRACAFAATLQKQRVNGGGKAQGSQSGCLALLASLCRWMSRTTQPGAVARCLLGPQFCTSVSQDDVFSQGLGRASATPGNT